MSLVRGHPLITFLVLAYALTWLAWPMWALGFWPNPVFSFGPFLAALIVLALTRGKSGVGGLLRRMVRWRVELRWYAVALLLPAELALAATVLNVLLGAQAPSSVELGSWTILLLTFAIVLLIPGMGGAGLERLRPPKAANWPLSASCQPDPRSTHIRMAPAAYGSRAGPLLGRSADHCGGDHLQLGVQQRPRERVDHHADARHEQHHLGQFLQPDVLGG